MSRENVEVVRRLYEAFSVGDLGVAIGLLDPEIEWIPPANSPMAGVHRGIEAALSVVAEWTGAFEDYRWEVEELIDAGEKVIAVGKQGGRGPGSGIEIEAEQAHVWTLRDGRPVRMEMFPSRTEAIEAAALQGAE